MFSIILSIIVVLFFVIKLSGKSRTKELIEKIPGPKPIPIFGNTLDLAFKTREERLAVIAERDKKWYPLYRTYNFRTPFVHITSAEYAEPILSQNKELTKGFIYTLFEPWLGKGLLVSTDEHWFRSRKLITPTFHFKVLDSFVETFSEHGQIIVNKLKSKADTGEYFDISSLINLTTLDIICDTAMGTRLNWESNTNVKYVKALESINTITFMRYERIWLHNQTIFKYLPLGREYYRDLKVVHDFTLNIIEERKKARASAKTQGVEEEDAFGVKRKKAFLDQLLDLNESAKENNRMTDQEITDEVHTFMFEGHDTTSSSITFAIFLLALHPEVQEKVYEEQKLIFGDDMSRPVTTKDIASMHYLDMVIKESLRFLSSVPFISRRLKNEFTLVDKIIPKGTVTLIHINQIHRDPKWYTDPEKFNPNHFLPENVAARHPYAFIPFSAGPRNCIGQKFAYFEDKVVISSIVRSFKMETSNKLENMIFVAELVMKPSGGINIKLTSRNKKE